jgi:hypothetical protein
MLKRILLLALVASAVVAAPAFSVRPYRPEPVDFESGPGVQQRIGKAVQSEPIRAGKRFNLVGLHWRGGAEPGVSVRTRREGGAWTRWTPLNAHVEDAPDPGRGEPMPQGASAPTWVGEADWVQYRLTERVSGLRLHYVNVEGSATAADRVRTGLRRAAGAATAALIGNPTARAAESRPGMVSRAEWGASDCRPRSAPEYGEVKAAFVHHTVSANDYTREEAASVVLGICRYHRNSNGWNDIGYNFLVDKYGTLYEGRAGGTDAAVIGAQAQGYNAQTTGIANLGTHTSTPQSSAALDAMARLIRWKLPLHGAPTSGTTTLRSAGGDTNRYAAGRSVHLNRVAGHRDTNATTCPGSALYAQLPELRARVGSVGAGRSASTLTAELSPSTVGYRGRATVAGRLSRADGSAVGGPRVAVQVRSGRRYKTVAKARTNAEGRYSAVVRPRGTRVIRVRFGGGAGAAAATSPRLRLRVKPILTLSKLPPVASSREPVPVSGTVRPNKRRVFQVLQVSRGLGYRTLSTKAAKPRRGRFRFTLRAPRPGVYRVYYVVRADRSTVRLRTKRRTLIVR